MGKDEHLLEALGDYSKKEDAKEKLATFGGHTTVFVDANKQRVAAKELAEITTDSMHR